MNGLSVKTFLRLLVCVCSLPPVGRASLSECQVERLSHNMMRVRVTQSAATAKDDTLRQQTLFLAAEETLRHGYAYFHVAESDERIVQQRRLLTHVIVCYRRRPGHLRGGLYDARALFVELAAKLDKRDDRGILASPPRGLYHCGPRVIEFRRTVHYDPTLDVPDEYRVIWPSDYFLALHRQEAMLVAIFVDAENPLDTIRDFADAVRPIARQIGANALVIEDDPNTIRTNEWLFGGLGESPQVGFVAFLCVMPKTSLGVTWEPSGLAMKKHIVRSIREDSRALEAGLDLGDKVLEIEGVDVLNRREVIACLLNKQVRDSVRLTVVREGEAMDILVDLVGQR